MAKAPLFAGAGFSRMTPGYSSMIAISERVILYECNCTEHTGPPKVGVLRGDLNLDVGLPNTTFPWGLVLTGLPSLGVCREGVGDGQCSDLMHLGDTP